MDEKKKNRWRQIVHRRHHHFLLRMISSILHTRSRTIWCYQFVRRQFVERHLVVFLNKNVFSLKTFFNKLISELRVIFLFYTYVYEYDVRYIHTYHKISYLLMTNVNNKNPNFFFENKNPKQTDFLHSKSMHVRIAYWGNGSTLDNLSQTYM